MLVLLNSLSGHWEKLDVGISAELPWHAASHLLEFLPSRNLEEELPTKKRGRADSAPPPVPIPENYWIGELVMVAAPVKP